MSRNGALRAILLSVLGLAAAGCDGDGPVRIGLETTDHRYTMHEMRSDSGAPYVVAVRLHPDDDRLVVCSALGVAPEAAEEGEKIKRGVTVAHGGLPLTIDLTFLPKPHEGLELRGRTATCVRTDIGWRLTFMINDGVSVLDGNA